MKIFKCGIGFIVGLFVGLVICNGIVVVVMLLLVEVFYKDFDIVEVVFLFLGKCLAIMLVKGVVCIGLVVFEFGLGGKLVWVV